MVFLGFTDDVLDLKWRYKLILPTVASLPLLSSYDGHLVNIVAIVDTEAKGSIVELGPVFLLYMGLLAVFCTNSINIMAGINGLEVGQAYVIAAAVLCFKLYELFASQHQVFTILLVLPFIGTTLALMRHNWFPAKVFVGDTFCYFAVFRLVPCPRHRLPRLDPDAKECPNFTIICTVLRIVGPMKEKQLTILLLGLQILVAVMAFFLRYIVYEIPVH
eukprot:GSChrysophyteH1.ASY1.ANO1.1821.1 assembled CDS